VKVFRILLALVVNSTAIASVINVPAAQPTIQAAINMAKSGDTVLVAPGTYTENIDFMGKAITVKSSKGATFTILDGGGVAPVVTFATNETSSSTLSGFTLQNGASTTNSLYIGGGVFVYFAAPTISNNIIQNNKACAGGGGIGVYYGSPLIQGNNIKSNSLGCGGSGAGITVEGTGSAQIIGNTIRNNTSGFGGGIDLIGAGTPTIENNVISGNVATGDSPASLGGGIFIENVLPEDALILQNLIYGNSAGQGSGIYAFVPSGAKPLFVNNTIVGSSSSPQGSAVYITGYDDQAQFFNNLLIGRTGTNAVYCDNQYDPTPPTLTNNDAYSANGTGLLGTCAGESNLSGNISADPLFVNSYRLHGGSPAIDVGNNSAANLPATDRAGDQRIINGNDGPTAIVDLGAYEFVPVTVSPARLSFGLQLVGTSTNKTVKLGNAQNRVLNISSYSAPTGYAVTGCGSSLAAFSSCSLTVTFQPLSSGTFNGTLTITDDSGQSPQILSLSGKAH
jgi:Right handed beta helix region/Abnormal spindle-like microcephaly-assoc'd, ASPM-SPD-2-Hydin